MSTARHHLSRCAVVAFLFAAALPVARAQIVQSGRLYHIDVTNLNSYNPAVDPNTVFDLTANGGNFGVSLNPTLVGTAGQSDARLYWAGQPGGARLSGNATVASLTNLNTATFVTEVWYNYNSSLWPAGSIMSKGGDNYSENMAVQLVHRPGTNTRHFSMASWRSGANGGSIGVSALSSNTTGFLMRAGGMLGQTTGPGGSATVASWDFNSNVNHFLTNSIAFTAGEDTAWPVNALRLKNSTVGYGENATDFSFALARFYKLQDVFDDTTLGITTANQLLQRNYNAEAYRFGMAGVVDGNATGAWVTYGQTDPFASGPLGVKLTATATGTNADSLRLAQAGDGGSLVKGEDGLATLNLDRLGQMWTLTESGDVTADLFFDYSATELDPWWLQLMKRETPADPWIALDAVHNVAETRFELTGVESFSQFSFGKKVPEPSAGLLAALACALVGLRRRR